MREVPVGARCRLNRSDDASHYRSGGNDRAAVDDDIFDSRAFKTVLDLRRARVQSARQTNVQLRPWAQFCQEGCLLRRLLPAHCFLFRLPTALQFRGLLSRTFCAKAFGFA